MLHSKTGLKIFVLFIPKEDLVGDHVSKSSFDNIAMCHKFSSEPPTSTRGKTLFLVTRDETSCFLVRTGLHNFPYFLLICLIWDHINPCPFIHFNPPLQPSHVFMGPVIQPSNLLCLIRQISLELTSPGQKKLFTYYMTLKLTIFDSLSPYVKDLAKILSDLGTVHFSVRISKFEQH